MSHKSFAARCSAFAAAASLAIVPAAARATTYSGHGWVQLQKSSSNSTSTTIAGNDFGIGYTAYFGLEGYNWDVAPNNVNVSCVSYDVEYELPLIGSVTIPIVESTCPTLPGTKLSSTTASSSASYDGYPATKKTTTVVWDVPDAGAMAEVEGYFSVPVTLFDEDFDLFKLTGYGIGRTYASDLVSADVYVLGAKIYGDWAYLPASTRIAEKCQTLAEADASFSLLGIPVTVSASADGCIYVDASASFAGRTLSGSLTPGASVDATLKAGVGGDAGFASASAGIYGNITVIDASVPLTISAAVLFGGVTVTESAKLTMTGLDGEAGFYVEGCLFGICEEATKEIFDWTGMTYASTTIFSASQTVSY